MSSRAQPGNLAGPRAARAIDARRSLPPALCVGRRANGQCDMSGNSTSDGARSRLLITRRLPDAVLHHALNAFDVTLRPHDRPTASELGEWAQGQHALLQCVAPEAAHGGNLLAKP